MRFAVLVQLLFLLTISCVTVIPQSETVIRLPQEHEYVSHAGRIPMIYVRTLPREYWDFSLAFQTADTNGILMTGEALIAALQEGLGTVFKTTKRAASGDFLAVVDLERFSFRYLQPDEGSMEFKASLSFFIVDKAGRKVDDVTLHASVITLLPEEKSGQLRTAVDAVAELLSLLEKDLGAHTRKAWEEGRYSVF